MALPGVFNQVSWPGVGDVDDCQVLSAFWTMVATGWSTKAGLPTVSKFRYEAGNPDDPGRSDGLNNTESLRAINQIWPTAGALSYVGGIEGFKAHLRAGKIASVSVKSSLLPARLRFGFLGLHQIAVAFNGTNVKVMNPLDAMGDPPMTATWAEVRVAAYGVYNDGKVHAIVVPPKPADPTIALKAEIAALKTKVSSQQTTIDALTAKITAARSALL